MTLKLNERYPGRFNNPSSDYPQGSFKNRTAPSAKNGSYLEQDWANDKEGFFQSMISKAALAPNGLVDKVGSSQLFNALIRLIQNQEGVAYTTTGASGTFVITPSPAVPSYSLYLRLQVVFNTAGGANPTINISGLGAKSLKQYNSSGVKIPAAISSGQSSDIFYDGTDVVVLDQLPNSTGVTAPQFDNSLNLATTAWVRGVGKRYSSIAVATTTYTVTVANAGGLVLGNAASLFNAVLPSAAALPPGETITIYCYGAGGMQVYVAGSDTINFPPSIVTDFLVVQGMSITLASNGINAWYVTSQNAVGAKPSQFDSSGKYATTSFVQGVGLQFSGTFALSANTTLTAATHAGGLIVANSASLITVTLPAASTMPSKTTIKLFSYAAGGMTIAAAGSDSIYLPATNTTFAVPMGAWITLASNGTNGWYAIGMSGAGVGQAYVNMTGLRVSGTTYPNPTGKQITVIANLTSGTGGSAATVTVGGVSGVIENGQGAGTTRFSVSFPVPASTTYSFNAGSATIASVWEYK